MEERDLPAADRVVRLAFGTFLGLPDPMQFMGDAQYTSTRWKADPQAAFAAELHGQIVGSVFASNWGSVGFFGPLTVRPDLWGGGIARRLLEPVTATFDRWGVRQRGLFTFPHSTKHIHLYQKFGFWPRTLTALMSRAVELPEKTPITSAFSRLQTSEKSDALAAGRAMTEEVYPGLDLSREIESVDRQALGETLLLWEGPRLEGLAVCHGGAGTEAGGGRWYVKFAAVRPGAGAETRFNRLLDACFAEASARGLQKVVAGMNTARHEAYRIMLNRGFRADMNGVVMQNPNEPAYNREGMYVIDDWR